MSSPQDGATALHMASMNGHEEVVRQLLQSGAKNMPNNVRICKLYLLLIVLHMEFDNKINLHAPINQLL